MRLTPDQLERFADHLTRNVPDFTCPICDSVEWIVDENLVLLPSPPVEQPGVIHVARAQGQQQPPSAVASPVVQVFCARCKAMQLFAAGALGLFGPGRGANVAAN